MTAPRTTPKAAALAWWKSFVDAERYVVSRAQCPSPAIRRVLRSQRLVLEVAGGRVWILTEPNGPSPRSVFLRNYWAVIAQLMEQYRPSCVVGGQAVRLHLGELTPPTTLQVEHATNRSRYALALFDEFTLQLHPAEIDHAHLVTHPTIEAQISVLRPAHLLTTLDLCELQNAMEPISAWMRHLVVKTPELEAAVDARPRPVVLARLRNLAADLQNTSLATQLTTAIAGVAARIPSRVATGVGVQIRIPAPLIAPPRGSDRPWLDRQRMTLARFSTILDRLFAERLPAVTPPPMAQRLTEARLAKQYDTYHNATMEGYRISKKASDAVVAGTAGGFDAISEQDRRAVMAVQGYSAAFDTVLGWLSEKRPRPITEGAILDLSVALFQPSVDLGIVTADKLRRWRTINVGLNGGWRHAPPGYEKVGSLIEGLCAFLQEEVPARHPVTRALLTHLDFVTTHPLVDGNGRLSRLLMNHLLLQHGYPWVTIRADERTPYFRALEAAQVDGNIAPLGEFLAHTIRLTIATRQQ